MEEKVGILVRWSLREVVTQGGSTVHINVTIYHLPNDLGDRWVPHYKTSETCYALCKTAGQHLGKTNRLAFK